jgi:hypothetical protein
MSLQEWLNDRLVESQSTSKNEIVGLLEKVDQHLIDAHVEVISLDLRLTTAYSACLKCATIALRACGYRVPSGAGQHFRTIESLRFTIKPKSESVIFLHSISKKRGQVSYDATATTTKTELQEAINFAEELREIIQVWLNENYPELL